MMIKYLFIERIDTAGRLYWANLDWDKPEPISFPYEPGIGTSVRSPKAEVAASIQADTENASPVNLDWEFSTEPGGTVLITREHSLQRQLGAGTLYCLELPEDHRVVDFDFDGTKPRPWWELATTPNRRSQIAFIGNLTARDDGPLEIRASIRIEHESPLTRPLNDGIPLDTSWKQKEPPSQWRAVVVTLGIKTAFESVIGRLPIS